MAKNLKIVLNRSAIRNQLLKSNEMMEICKELGNTALNRCGEGYDISAVSGKNRVNVSVYARTNQARKDNMENNTILKALRG